MPASKSSTSPPSVSTPLAGTKGEIGSLAGKVSSTDSSTLEPELALIRQRFLIDGVPTADLALGRFAVSTGIATEL